MALTVTNNFKFYDGSTPITNVAAAKMMGISISTLASRIRLQRTRFEFDREALLCRDSLPSGCASKVVKKRSAEHATLHASSMINGFLVEVFRPTLVKIDGEITTIKEAAVIFNVKKTTLIYRIERLLRDDGSILIDECFSRDKIKTRAKATERRGLIVRHGLPDPHMKIPAVMLNNKWLRVAL